MDRSTLKLTELTDAILSQMEQSEFMESTELSGKEYLETPISDYNYLNEAIHNILSHDSIQQEE